MKNKKGGRPRTKEIRRYQKDEKGMRIFDIADLIAEIPAKIIPGRRGNVYIGTDFENHDVVVLVMRKRHEADNT